MLKPFFFLAIFSSLLFCQTSLDTDLDAVSIAMGESFTANPNGILTGDHNPAALKLHTDPSISFSRRSMNWWISLEDMVYYSGKIAVPTGIGNFSLIYKRLNWGEVTISTIDNPEGAERVNVYDQTIILSYSNQIVKNLYGGLNIKTTHNSNMGGYEYNYPLMADAGLLYSIPGPIQRSGVDDQFYFGAVLQNYGTDYTLKGDNIERYNKVPRYLKLGMSYILNVADEEKNLFRFIFSADYKNNVNGPDYEKDYWGMGFESTFFDMLSLRIGGITRPHNSIYGVTGNMAIRYGAGVNIPFRRFGINSPLALSFDYAVIPLFTSQLYYFDPHKRNLNAFNLQLEYAM